MRINSIVLFYKRKMAKKRSVIWEFFTISENTKYAVCNTCQTSVSRGGGSTKSYTTTNLVSHLAKHPDVNKQYSELKKSKETTPLKPTRKRRLEQQLSLEDTQELSKPWDINDARSQRVHKRIGEMLAVDCQPLSMVEDIGFKRVLQSLEPRYKCPSRKYYTDTIIPRIYTGMKEEVSKLVGGAKHISFTTDIWSSSINITCLLSLTAHWINDTFVKVSAVLHAQPIQEAHTGEYIAAQLENMLQNWEIPRDKVHIVVSDNASNMIRAMGDASFVHFGCFAHSLQLVIKDGLFVQRAISDIIAICRNIVGHFHRSSVAGHNLKRIQESLNVPQHKLKSDVVTRWNSTLYMFESVLEQKTALAAYCAETGSIQQLTPHQLELMKKCVDVLSPVEEITRSISADLASISIVIPYIRILTRTLEKNTNDSGIQTMKGELLKSLKCRFAGVEERKELALATLLDPRFKDKFFSGNIIKATVKEMLVEEMNGSDVVSEAAAEEPGPSQSKRTCPLKSGVLLDVISEIITDSIGDIPATTSEVEKFLSDPLLDYKTGNPYTWWAENKRMFPNLSSLAQHYLCPPATSVPSERLFSAAGNLHDDKRNRILPTLTEDLLFIQNNFCLAGSQYKFK